jgi:hypothetical protein
MAITFGLLEVWLIGFPFFIVFFTRHIYNLSRNCLPQCDLYKVNSWLLNLYSTLRNISILIAVLLLNDKGFPYAIYFITVFELVLLFIGGGRYSKIRLNFNVFRFSFIYKNILKIKKSNTQIGIFSGALASIDRVIIGLFFTPDAQVVFLKYKLMYQYIDGFFGVFGYQIHLSIIKTRKIIKPHVALGLLLCMVSVGMVGSVILLDIDSYLGYVLVFIIVIMMSTKRLTDGVVSSYLISICRFHIVAIKSLIEIILITVTLIISYEFYRTDIDKVYLIYVFVTLCVSSVFIFNLIMERKNECN